MSRSSDSQESGLNSHENEEFFAQVDRLLDGPVDEVLEAEVMAQVTQDEAKKRLFAERLYLSGMIGHMLQGVSLADGSDLQQALAMPVRKSGTASGAVPPWLFSVVSLIAILAMFAVTYQTSARWMRTAETVATQEKNNALSAPAPVVAILTHVGRCQWGSNAQPTSLGTSLHAGTVELVAGVAELSFVSGAKMKLEGPAVLELVSPLRCRLDSGAVTMSVPASAQGFTIESPTGDVIDYGTEFGMRVEQGRAHVQVFKGEVEVASKNLKESERLFQGHAATMTTTRIDVEKQSNKEYPSLEEMRAAQMAMKSRHRIPSSEGNGAAEYVYSPGSYNNMSETLLLVKHQAEQSWRRIAYLRFDVSKLPETLKDFNAVSLTLSFVPSGIGYASTMPDCDFTVYGLLNEDADSWSASGLTWENAPGINGEEDLNRSLVVPLARFRIDRDETTGVRVLATPELTEFLKQDTNGLVTLVIARDTLGVGSSSLVHAFAGNRHPTVAPPSLEFRKRGE
ncbi:CBM96 family carbohydrate-binding protein [Lacunimicrobium album]